MVVAISIKNVGWVSPATSWILGFYKGWAGRNPASAVGEMPNVGLRRTITAVEV